MILLGMVGLNRRMRNSVKGDKRIEHNECMRKHDYLKSLGAILIHEDALSRCSFTNEMRELPSAFGY